eukprot:199297_1
MVNNTVCYLWLFLVIFRVNSDLECGYVKNIAYTTEEGDTRVIGVFPLNKCTSFYQQSTDQFESERYSCDGNDNLRVSMWYNNGNCNGDSDFWAYATADRYNCDGKTCDNILYITQTNIVTTSSETCPEVDGENDKKGKAFHIFDECYKFESGSMIETCDDDSIITYYQYSDLNCTQNKKQVFTINNECVNRLDSQSCHCTTLTCAGNNIADSAFHIDLNQLLSVFCCVIYFVLF